jgi:hypothetical protein
MPHGATGTKLDPSAPWWRELHGYHWWVLCVATLGWLFDSMDQRLFVLARTPALRELLPGVDEATASQYAGYATSIFILGWATGGLIFGLGGDRWGRTRTMMVTILLYSLFTGLSALSVGWWDFAAFRFFCGMGIGGEYAAGVALVAESMPDRARPYCLGMLQGMAALGQVGGSVLSLFIGPQAELAGVAGWRWLFAVGVLPALLVVVIRLGLREPQRWVQARQSESQASDHRLGDFREIFRDPVLRRNTLVGMILGMSGQIGLWGIGYWTPELIRTAVVLDSASISEPTDASAAIHRRAQDRLVAYGTVLQDCAGMFGIYAFTFAAVRWGRVPTFAFSYLAAFCAAIATFGWLRRESDVFWMIPMLGFCVSSVYGGFAVYFPELYPTRLRSTGTGFCYNVARYITALGPLALGKLTILYAASGYSTPLRPAAVTLAMVYLAGISVLTIAPETKGRPLPE